MPLNASASLEAAVMYEVFWRASEGIRFLPSPGERGPGLAHELATGGTGKLVPLGAYGLPWRVRVVRRLRRCPRLLLAAGWLLDHMARLLSVCAAFCASAASLATSA